MAVESPRSTQVPIFEVRLFTTPRRQGRSGSSLSLLFATVLLSAGCGGGTEPSPPPPPPPPPAPGPPATISITGDAQVAEPGVAITVAPAVTVRDAANRPVPGVAVAFTVDSGGGSIANPSGTTDAAGVASPGAWTLGPEEGQQVLGVTVGSLPKAKIRATARLAATTGAIPGGGGTITVTRPQSPLAGLTVTLPAGAYPGATQWSITALGDIVPTLPAKVRQVGPTIQIRNDQGFAQLPFRIEIPARIGPDSTVGAFFRDPATGKLEAIPVLARTDSSLVLLTQHVAADQMLLPQSAAGVADAAIRTAAPGAVEIVVVGVGVIDLRVRYNTSFQPGVDDWEFPNYGSYPEPGGFCAGSTLSAIYHNYVRKAAKGPLFGRYDSLPGPWEDNPRGIRLASVVQTTIDWDAGRIIAQQIQGGLSAIGQVFGGPAYVRTQMESLSLAMLVTGQAQQLAIYKHDMSDGHALAAYAVEWGRIFVADPNEPGVPHTIEFTDDGFVPFDFAPNADAPEVPYSRVFPMAASALMPVRRMDALWGKLEAGTIGDAEFLDQIYEYRDPVDTVWRKAEGTIVTASSRLTFRTLCPACRTGRGATSSHPARALTVLYNGFGGLIGDDDPDPADGVEIPVAKGTNGYGLAALSFSAAPAAENDGEWYYQDFEWLQVKSVDFTLRMDPARPEPGQTITFTVENGGIGTSSSKYRWLVGDEDPIMTSFSEPTLTRSFDDPIGQTVIVELLHEDGGKLARAGITIGAGYWRITSITDQDELFGGDIDGSGPIHDLLERLLAAPQAGLIAIAETEGGGTELQLRVLKGSAWDPGACCPVPDHDPATEMLTLLGVDPSIAHPVGPFFAGWETSTWSQTTPDLGSGMMTGQFVHGTKEYTIKDVGTQVGPLGGTRITASRTGTAMSGTISFTIWFVDSESGEIEEAPDEFRFPFTATRLR